MSSNHSHILALPALGPFAYILYKTLRNTFKYTFVFQELCVLASMQLFEILAVF
jgi:hypothetical protein